MNPEQWRVYHPEGKRRVVVTKALPGQRWLDILMAADCRVEICLLEDSRDAAEITTAMGNACDGVIGQLDERWDDALLAALKASGGRVYSNYAVGFNNLDVAAATRQCIPVGNTPGVLTETTAEMAVALTFAAARRIGESERYMRAGKFDNWLPTMFLGQLLTGKTVGVIGAGRIGATYARMMMAGQRMNVAYFDLHPNPALEDHVAAYGRFLSSQHLAPVTCTRVESVADLLKIADCVSVHTVLDESTHHLIDASRLGLMKPDAVLVNTSRGPVIDEAALVAHCRSHPHFRAGLDVFENEPVLAPGLDQLENVVIVPHIGSASRYAREGMATLAAANIAAILKGDPVWNREDIRPFLEGDLPAAAPSILNAQDIGLALYTSC